MLIRLCVVVCLLLMVDPSNGLFKNSQQSARQAASGQAPRISKRFAAMTHKIKTPVRLRALRRDSAHEGLETAETRYPGLAQNNTVLQATAQNTTAQNGIAQNTTVQNGTAFNSTAQPIAQDTEESNSTTASDADEATPTLPPSLAAHTVSSSLDTHFRPTDINVPPTQRLPFHEFGRKLRARVTTVPSNALQESGSASARPSERIARPLTDLEAENQDHMDVTFNRPFTETNKPARPHHVHHVMMVRRGDTRVQVDASEQVKTPANAPEVLADNVAEGSEEKKHHKHEDVAVEKPKSYLKLREDNVVEGNTTKAKTNRTSTGFTLMHRTREQIVGAKKSQTLAKSRHDASIGVTQRVRNASEMVANLTSERQAENAIVKYSRGNLTYKSSLLHARRIQKALVPVGGFDGDGAKFGERMEAMSSSHATRTTPTTTTSTPTTTTSTPTTTPPTTTTTTTPTPTTTPKPQSSSERSTTKMADFRQPTTKMADFRQPTSKILSTAVVTSISVLGDWTPITDDADKTLDSENIDLQVETDLEQPSVKVEAKMPRHVDQKTKETVAVTYSRTVPGSSVNVPMSGGEDIASLATTTEARTPSTTEHSLQKTSKTTEESVSRTTTTTERSVRTTLTTQASFRRTPSTDDSVRWTPSSTRASLTPSPAVDSVKRTPSTEEPVRWTPSVTSESVRRSPPTTTEEAVRWSPSTSERSVPRTASTSERSVPRTATTTAKKLPKTEASTETIFSLDAIPDEVKLNLRDGITTRRPGGVTSTTSRYAQNHRPAQETTPTSRQDGVAENKTVTVVHKGEVTLADVRRVIQDSVNQKVGVKEHGHVVFGDDNEVRRRLKEEEDAVDDTVDDGVDVSNYVLASFGVVPVVVGVLLAARLLISRRKKIWESEKSPLTFVSTNEWEFPRSKLRLQTVLGEGNFGLVYKAEADDILGERATRLVAVKTVKDNASSREKEDLARELAILKQIGSHSNVVTLLGCCTEKEPSLLILEYVMYGKLLSFLRDNRTRKQYFNFSEETAELTAKDLTSFAYCVARGMEYLASKGVIHRDLAARNVLVDHNKVCKVADFGMSRSVSEPDQIYEQAPAKGALPIRWMAPESLIQRVFTHKSDVWAFGILMWEIVTLGSTPYQSLSAREVIREVRDGHRLARPPHCRAELYRVAATCWAHDPVQRPSFADVKQQLGALLEQGEAQAYVDLDSYIESISGSRASTQHTTQVVNL